MRLIDADAIVKRMVYKGEAIGDFGIGQKEAFDVLRKLVDNAPTIDPVKRGEWLTDRFGMERSICSECRKVFETGGNYCPSCGARMEDDLK